MSTYWKLDFQELSVKKMYLKMGSFYSGLNVLNLTLLIKAVAGVHDKQGRRTSVCFDN